MPRPVARTTHYDGGRGGERSVGADDLAPAFEQDDVAPTTGGVLAEPALDADDAEADALVQGKTSVVLRHDTSEQRPVAGRLGRADKRLEEAPTDAATSGGLRHVDALPRDAAVDLSRGVPAQCCPADDAV